MGKKLYHPTAEGGIAFKSTRQPWEVRIPAWVYDLWMPLVGAEAMGVYALYCRLEMNDGVRGITMRDIARAARIGDKRLSDINKALQDCGFITVNKPDGAKRLMHWTTEIIVHDPPQDIAATTIQKYQHPQGYTPVSKWLVGDAPETPSSVSDDTDQCDRNQSDGVSNIGTLGLVGSLDTTTTPTPPEPATGHRPPATRSAASAAGGGDAVAEGTRNDTPVTGRSPKVKDTPAAAYLRGTVRLVDNGVIAELGALDLDTVRKAWDIIRTETGATIEQLRGRLVRRLRADLAAPAPAADPVAQARKIEMDLATARMWAAIGGRAQ